MYHRSVDQQSVSNSEQELAAIDSKQIKSNQEMCTQLMTTKKETIHCFCFTSKTLWS